METAALFKTKAFSLVKNIPAAKQTIDILCMLESKIRGNLTDQESRLLRDIMPAKPFDGRIHICIFAPKIQSMRALYLSKGSSRGQSP